MTIEGKEPDVTKVQMALKVDRLERLVVALATSRSGPDVDEAIKQIQAEITERDQRIRSE